MPIGDVDPAEYFLSDEVYDLRKLFSQFDTSGDGTISSNELHPLFQMAGIMIKPYQIEHVVKEFDIDGSGEIDFEEFMVMMVKLQGRKPRPGLIDYRDFITEEKIEKYEKQFRKADKDGAGSLDAQEIEALFHQFGMKLTSDQVENLMSEVDHDNSGQIEFDEFCCMMAKLTGARKRINPCEYMERVEIEKLRMAFDQIDANGSGTISTKELDALLRKMGITLDKPGVDRMLTKYDADNSGELEFQEFAAMMVDIKKLRRKRRTDSEKVRKAIEKEEEDLMLKKVHAEDKEEDKKFRYKKLDGELAEAIARKTREVELKERKVVSMTHESSQADGDFKIAQEEQAAARKAQEEQLAAAQAVDSAEKKTDAVEKEAQAAKNKMLNKVEKNAAGGDETASS